MDAWIVDCVYWKSFAFFFFSVNWPTLYLTLYQIQHCHVPRIMRARNVDIVKRFSFRLKHVGPKKKWDCIMCAQIQIVCIDGPSKLCCAYLQNTARTSDRFENVFFSYEHIIIRTKDKNKFKFSMIER